MAFQKAVKYKSKLRCAIFGPSGSGKTMSALRIATGMKGKIALIDSERGSASKYADKFVFDVVDLNRKTIDEYVNFINEASEAGYSVLIIDSLTHAWQELLEDIDRIAKAKYRGNSWSAWSEGTPKQKRLLNAILDCKCHIIATMRSKTEWTLNTGENGKVAPTRVGLAPEQGKGIEYEFDMLFEISTEHVANVIKDRTGKFQDKLFEKPDEQLGQSLIDWLNEGNEKQLPQGDYMAAKQAIESETDVAKIEFMKKQIATRSWEEGRDRELILLCEKQLAVRSHTPIEQVS